MKKISVFVYCSRILRPRIFLDPEYMKKLTHWWLVLCDQVRRCVQFLFGSSGNSPYTARFMSDLEKLELLSAYNNGIVVNGRLRLDLDKSYRHLLLTGATGAGKSSTVFIPMILSLDFPMIILDCSGSLFDSTSGILRKKGFRILRLNFSDPLHSECYNVLHRANTDSKIKRVATTLVETSLGKSKGGDSFWNLSAAQILYCLIRCLKESVKPKYQNLANVRHLLNNLSSSKDSPSFKWIVGNASDEVFTEFKGAMASSEKVIDSVLATCRASLEKLADPSLARMTATDTLGDLQKLRQRKTALYLSVKETEISYLNFLIAIVLGDLLDMAMEMPSRKDKPLFFCLDEFSHFKIKDFSTMLTTLRKRDVSCTISVQSKSMLRHQYGEADAESIITGGCASHLILPGQNNPRENQQLSKLLGDHLVNYKGKDMVLPILSPDEIYSLKGKGIFLHSGYRPTLLKLYPFYKNKSLLKMTQMRPVSYKRKLPPKVELVDLANHNVTDTPNEIAS